MSFFVAGRVCLVRTAALQHRRHGRGQDGRGQDGRAAVYRGAAESGIEAAGGVDEAGVEGAEDGRGMVLMVFLGENLAK